MYVGCRAGLYIEQVENESTLLERVVTSGVAKILKRGEGGTKPKYQKKH